MSSYYKRFNIKLHWKQLNSYSISHWFIYVGNVEGITAAVGCWQWKCHWMEGKKTRRHNYWWYAVIYIIYLIMFIHLVVCDMFYMNTFECLAFLWKEKSVGYYAWIGFIRYIWLQVIWFKSWWPQVLLWMLKTTRIKGTYLHFHCG